MAAELAARPNDRLSILANVVWDPHVNQVNNTNLQMSYRWRFNSLINAGYTYRRPVGLNANQPISEQTHLSAWVPLGDSRWTLFAAWNYSLQANTSVEQMAGFEYDTCCWQARVLYLSYFDTDRGNQFLNPDDPDLERENSVQFQVQLKGLGGFGGRVTGILEDMIRGFRDREI
jgi:LPS-assembly protein